MNETMLLLQFIHLFSFYGIMILYLRTGKMQLCYLYKGKVFNSNCGDYRGISLLEAVGKVFSKVLSNRLRK